MEQKNKRHWRDLYIVLFATVITLGIPLIVAYVFKQMKPEDIFNEVLDKGFLGN